MLWTVIVGAALAAPMADQTSGQDDSAHEAGEVALDGRDQADAPEAIIHGEDASEDDWPMAGGLLMDANITFGAHNVPLNIFICSSTLIAPDVVLLAAHCVDPVAINYAMTFGFGTTDIYERVWSRAADLTEWSDGTATSLPEDSVSVLDVRYHEDFDIQALGYGFGENHDIAVMFLAEPVLDVPLGVLPTLDEAAQMEIDAPVVVVGWGQQVATDVFEAPPPGTIAIKQQGDSFISDIGATEIKIGEVESDVRKCHGDSGGPTFMEVDADSTDLQRVIGVTSHGWDQTDCFETGGADTRVDTYLDWIEEQMVEACNSGLRVWCDEPGILPPDYVVVESDTDTDTDTDTDVDTDTDTDADTDVDTGELGDTHEGSGKGCGCGTGSPGGALLVLGAALALRRRRR